MRKNQLIGFVNHNYNGLLSAANTSFGSINKSKEVWWLNIPVHKFNDDVHLLLNVSNYSIWLCLPKGFAKGVPFKIREDKNAVDLEISADKSIQYLKDVKSGGTGFDFKPYVKEKFKFID
ncbi:hypothetical protein BC962_2177 [Gillisia mitskevichiae]|uniref:Uncharacterized protein n=1 Tax=Gillisia mitskevichiae TaxID=270921 RepID=A0A495PVU8_9FLAO|nr:hypothetical protein [Gillisia mitskevichiae]RKS53910.1 hypothetical protein BC962_2177 [Gillisia mitskevichiae]